MRFEVKTAAEMPLDPGDPFRDLLGAFKLLREGEVLCVDAESKEPRKVGQVLAGVRRAMKRADIDNFQTRRDADTGTVWLWRKKGAAAPVSKQTVTEAIERSGPPIPLGSGGSAAAVASR